MKTYWHTFKNGTLEGKIDLVFFFFWFLLGVVAFWAHNTVLPYFYLISGLILYYSETKKNKDIFFPFDIHRHHGSLKGLSRKDAKKDIPLQDFLPPNLLHYVISDSVFTFIRRLRDDWILFNFFDGLAFRPTISASLIIYKYFLVSYYSVRCGR